MSENLDFYKGLESNLPKSGIVIGALYHCTDTKNTYIGVSTTKMELWANGAIKRHTATKEDGTQIIAGAGTETTVASGALSFAEGNLTNALGKGSHAEGGFTFAEGDNSHAEGYSSIAHGQNSHAEGSNTRADGDNSHAEGDGYSWHNLTISGEANVSIYTYTGGQYSVLKIGDMLYSSKDSTGVATKVIAIDADNKTITLEKTLSTSSAVNTKMYF